MGGPGSGRWHCVPTKRAVEDGKKLSVDKLRTILKAGECFWGSYSWSIGGKPSGSIGMMYTPDSKAGWLRLHYTVTGIHGKRTEEDYQVELERIPCNYGGVRVYFRCPVCSKCAAVLYLPPGDTRFACRKCHNLTYQSCKDSHRFDALYSMIAGSLGATAEEVKRVLGRTATKDDYSSTW